MTISTSVLMDVMKIWQQGVNITIKFMLKKG